MLICEPEQLARFVIQQRKRLGLTQTELARKVGLKQKTISGF